jgi:hypothetical protein
VAETKLKAPRVRQHLRSLLRTGLEEREGMPAWGAPETGIPHDWPTERPLSRASRRVIRIVAASPTSFKSMLLDTMPH